MRRISFGNGRYATPVWSPRGALIAFTRFGRGGFVAAAAVADGCRLVTHAVSLGGVDTLIQHPAALTHRPVAPEARPSAGLLRLSVGLESPTDVMTDLARALAAVPGHAVTAEPELSLAT